MGKYFVVLSLQAVILVLSFHSGDCIKCYICNSSNDPNCKDPFDTNAIEATECSTSGVGELYETLKKGLKGLSNLLGTDSKGLDLDFECQKIIASDNEGKPATVRTCTISKSTGGLDTCSLTSEIENNLKGKLKIDFCGTCDKDYCNGASKYSTSLLLLTLVPSLAVLLRSYFNV